jgi:hypothetical protein
MACHGRQRQTLSGEAQAILDGIAPIAMTRFNGRSLQELCVMGGFTREEFTRSVADREIDGQGRQEGWTEGPPGRPPAGSPARCRQQGELDLALRQCRRRCGEHTSEQVACVRALPLERLEDLAEALLDFQGAVDLDTGLGAAV